MQGKRKAKAKAKAKAGQAWDIGILMQHAKPDPFSPVKPDPFSPVPAILIFQSPSRERAGERGS